jgi:formate C-acetyltransferase
MIQLDHQIDTYMAQSRALLGKHYELVPVPFLSALVGGCLEKAMDITEGGARYYMNGVMMTGLPNTSDSLSAIKTLVFDQQRISLGDLLVALERDFDGHEKLRQLLINKSPKYGNDEDLVDRIGVDIARHFAEKVISNNRKYPPDGRKAQAPLAPNLGPVPGRDITGPTALIHSFGKFEHEFLAAGAELNLSMNTKDFEGEVGLGRLTGLIKAFLKTKGTVLNIALNDVETLKKAQQSPEEYRNLRVRMGGWSAYFVLLDKRNQDHHIARYSH